MERRMLILLGVITIMIAGVLFLVGVGGEEENSLSGHVYDTEGSPLENATINLGDAPTNYSISNESGYYSIQDIPTIYGSWHIEVVKDGYWDVRMIRKIFGDVIQEFYLEKKVVWYVDDDAEDGGNGTEDQPFNRIQDAINASDDRDTIRVYDGTYFENVIVNKSVCLIGNGSEVTTIDGGGNGDVVTITADWVNISGFNITNAGTNQWDAGMRILSDYGDIKNCIVLYNSMGILLENVNHTTILDNIIMENSWSAIACNDSRNVMISMNNCSENRYNGLYIRDSEKVTINSNDFSKSGDSGGCHHHHQPQD